MDFLCHFSKVGLLAPALVSEIVILSFFPCPQVPPTHHNTCWLTYRTLKVNSHRHQTNDTTYDIRPHPTTKHVIITAAAASSVAASAPGNHRRGRPPPRQAPDDDTTTRRDDRAEVPDQAAAQSWERQGTVFCAPPPPWTAGTTTMRTGWPAA